LEHRIALSHKEAFELANKLTFINSSFVKDTYTGTKRIREEKRREGKNYNRKGLSNSCDWNHS